MDAPPAPPPPGEYTLPTSGLVAVVKKSEKTAKEAVKVSAAVKKLHPPKKVQAAAKDVKVKAAEVKATSQQLTHDAKKLAKDVAKTASLPRGSAARKKGAKQVAKDKQAVKQDAKKAEKSLADLEKAANTLAKDAPTVAIAIKAEKVASEAKKEKSELKSVKSELQSTANPLRVILFETYYRHYANSFKMRGQDLEKLVQFRMVHPDQEREMQANLHMDYSWFDVAFAAVETKQDWDTLLDIHRLLSKEVRTRLNVYDTWRHHVIHDRAYARNLERYCETLNSCPTGACPRKMQKDLKCSFPCVHKAGSAVCHRASRTKEAEKYIKSKPGFVIEKDCATDTPVWLDYELAGGAYPLQNAGEEKAAKELLDAFRRRYMRRIEDVINELKNMEDLGFILQQNAGKFEVVKIRDAQEALQTVKTDDVQTSADILHVQRKMAHITYSLIREFRKLREEVLNSKKYQSRVDHFCRSYEAKEDCPTPLCVFKEGKWFFQTKGCVRNDHSSKEDRAFKERAFTTEDDC